MKRLLSVVLAVAVLSVPAAAVAMTNQVPSSTLSQNLGAAGTDVAASDQQSPTTGDVRFISSPSASGFDWGDAAVGGAIALLAIVAIGAGVRRRHTHSIALG